MTTHDIVITGLQPWDISIGSNCKNIAQELSRQHRVLYVNMPADRISLLRKSNTEQMRNRLAVLKGRQPAVQQVAHNIWVLNPQTVLESINWLQPAWLFDKLNRNNNARLAREIQLAIKQLGFGAFTLFNDSSMFKGRYLAQLLQPAAHVYYVRDNLISQPYFKRHGVRCEAALMAEADVVVANSTWLANYARKHNPEAYYVGQGCDLTAFKQEETPVLPPELKTLSGPIIGYVGYLTATRLDIEALVQLATNRPDWNVVLVGPEDAAFKGSKLHAMPNVLFTGSKPPHTLPQYIQGFDVCINPQAVNPMTIGNYPRKIDEYLAMGKPTVATHTSAMEVFADHVLLATSHREMVTHIQTALATNTPEKAQARIAFASGHTWQNSVTLIKRALFKALSKKRKNPATTAVKAAA